MSKKQKSETEAPKVETAFEVGQLVKASKDGEVAFVGPIERAQGFADVYDIAPLTPDEAARYAIVTQQTTLGMGNIIDAVVNGG